MQAANFNGIFHRGLSARELLHVLYTALHLQSTVVFTSQQGPGAVFATVSEGHRVLTPTVAVERSQLPDAAVHVIDAILRGPGVQS